jgi:hypothetical protein
MRMKLCNDVENLIFLRKTVWRLPGRIIRTWLTSSATGFTWKIAKLFLKTSAEILQSLAVAKVNTRKCAKMLSRRNALLFLEARGYS